MKAVLGLIGGLLAAALAQAALAQGDGDTTYLVPPEPIEVGSPVFPEDAKGDEAWIQLSFTVKADGTTADFAMSDGFGTETFKASSIAAARHWKFKPGTENGNAVDWTNYTYDIFFAYPNAEGGAYPEFSSRYEAIAEMLNQQRYADARSEILGAFDSGAVRLLYEYAIAELVLHSAEAGLGNRQAAYKAIRSATPVVLIPRQVQRPELGTRISKEVQLSSKGILPDDTMKMALRQRFADEGNLGLFLDALDTYERIAKLEELAPSDPLNNQVQVIRNALAGDQPLGVSARIENGTWFNRPARRIFGFASVIGTINNIRIACNRYGAVVTFESNADWELPAEWGDCNLVVTGSDGTEFVFVQSGAQIAARAAQHEPITVLATSEQVDIPQPPLPPPSSTPY